MKKYSSNYSSKRSLMSLFMLAVLIFSLVPSTLATATYETVTGNSMTVEDFSQKFGSKERVDLDSNTSISNLDSVTPLMEISSININNNQITFVATVTNNGVSQDLLASGQLYNSFRQQDGTNSIIGKLNDENENFKVAYFNIFNDTEDAWFYSDNSWYMLPHLKVYLEDMSGNLLLFETEIPESLKNLVIENSENSPEEVDSFWFMPYITSYTIAEVPGTGSDAVIDDIFYAKPTTRASGGETYYLPEYELEALFNGVIYENTAQPSIYFDINNIPSTGYWRIDFELENCATTVYGNTYPGSSFIAFSDIQFAVGAGQYTTLDFYTIFGDGNKKSGLTFSEGSSIAINLVSLGADALGVTIPPVGVAVSTIKSILEATMTKTNVVIGSQYSENIEPQSLGIGVTLPSGYTLTDEGHNFCIKVDASFDDFGDDVSSINTPMSFRCFFDYGTIIQTGTHYDSTGYINVPYYVADR